MARMTRESLNAQIAGNTVAQKYAKRIGLLESARKAVGAKPMSTFEKYYAGQLFENLSKGNGVSVAFKGHWAFPETAYEMLLTGEKTGKLGEMMEHVSTYYQEEQTEKFILQK